LPWFTQPFSYLTTGRFLNTNATNGQIPQIALRFAESIRDIRMFVLFVMKIQAFGEKRSVLDYTRAMPTAQQQPEMLCERVESLALAARR